MENEKSTKPTKSTKHGLETDCISNPDSIGNNGNNGNVGNIGNIGNARLLQ